jgi:hypothetical protein
LFNATQAIWPGEASVEKKLSSVFIVGVIPADGFACEGVVEQSVCQPVVKL